MIKPYQFSPELVSYTRKKFWIPYNERKYKINSIEIVLGNQAVGVRLVKYD